MEKFKSFLMNNFIAFFVIYFFTLFVDTTSLIVDYPVLEKMSKIIRYLVYIPMAMRLVFLLPEYKKLFTKKNKKDKSKLLEFAFIIFVIMVIGLIISAITTTNRRNLFVIFILLSAYKTDYKKIIKATMIMQIILTSCTVLMSVMGVTRDYIVARGSIRRHSLGFSYPTNLSQMLMFACTLYIYSVGKNVKYSELFAMQFANALVYYVTNTRAEFLLLELIIIATGISKLFRGEKGEAFILKVKKGYSYFFSRTFPIYPIISFIICLSYKWEGIWVKLNYYLSNRLKQTVLVVYEHGIKLFGEKIEFLGLGLKEKLAYGNYSSNFVDNEYIQLMLSEGLVFITCFIILLSILLIMLYKKGKYGEVILCSVYLLFGLINPRIVNLLYCPILFMVIPTFLGYKESKAKVNE